MQRNAVIATVLCLSASTVGAGVRAQSTAPNAEISRDAGGARQVTVDDVRELRRLCPENFSDEQCQARLMQYAADHPAQRPPVQAAAAAPDPVYPPTARHGDFGSRAEGEAHALAEGGVLVVSCADRSSPRVSTQRRWDAPEGRMDVIDMPNGDVATVRTDARGTSIDVQPARASPAGGDHHDEYLADLKRQGGRPR